MLRHAPQILYLVLVAAGRGINISEHGKLPTRKNNAYTSLIASAIAAAILWWGGFFK